MEEKDRFTKLFENCIEDNVKNITYCVNDRITICNLLNQQDKRIKDLEDLVIEYKNKLYRRLDQVDNLINENQQLKQQLHELSKE